METTVINTVASQGIWACLFVWMLFKTMKENKLREDKMNETIEKNQSIIQSLAKSLEMVNEIQEDIEEIKSGLKPQIK